MMQSGGGGTAQPPSSVAAANVWPNLHVPIVLPKCSQSANLYIVACCELDESEYECRSACSWRMSVEGHAAWPCAPLARTSQYRSETILLLGKKVLRQKITQTGTKKQKHKRRLAPKLVGADCDCSKKVQSQVCMRLELWIMNLSPAGAYLLHVQWVHGAPETFQCIKISTTWLTFVIEWLRWIATVKNCTETMIALSHVALRFGGFAWSTSLLIQLPNPSAYKGFQLSPRFVSWRFGHPTISDFHHRVSSQHPRTRKSS